jgi:hypothetical protein
MSHRQMEPLARPLQAHEEPPLARLFEFRRQVRLASFLKHHLRRVPSQRRQQRPGRRNASDCVVFTALDLDVHRGVARAHAPSEPGAALASSESRVRGRGGRQRRMRVTRLRNIEDRAL